MSLSNLSLMVQSLTLQPLALEGRFLHSFVNLIRRHNLGASFTGAEIHAELAVAHPRAGRESSGGDRTVAVTTCWSISLAPR